MLVGLLTPDSGSLRILGMDAAGDKPKIRQRIGYMPELPKFPKHLTGEELLDVYGRMYGMSKEERRRKTADLLKMVGLAGRGRDKIGKYSKGMQQRIGIARIDFDHACGAGSSGPCRNASHKDSVDWCLEMFGSELPHRQPVRRSCSLVVNN